MAKRAVRIVVGVAIAIFVFASLWQLVRPVPAPDRIPYSAFRDRVDAGTVTDVSVSTREITGHGSDGSAFSTTPVADPTLLESLRRNHVEVTGAVEPVSDGAGWLSILFFLGLGVLAWTTLRSPLGAGGANAGAAAAISRSKARIFVEKEVKVTFADAAGVEEAKVELQEVVSFLREPQRYRALGGRVPKGVLLVGPPGTGKTLLARAVAGEAGVPFFSISGSEFVEIFVGVGAARVRDLFAQARAKAPSIVFVDELDALGKTRGPAFAVTHEEREQTLNQLLVELDGFDPSGGVIVLAATNRPEILDPALLRAGRFDRQILVDRPERAGRKAILALHARKVPLAPDADLDAIAAITTGMAGADLAMVVNEAALLAARARATSVGQAQLLEAVERVVAGLEKKSRVLTAPERERVATHELGHALVTHALRGNVRVRKISIVPRGVAALGYTLQSAREDRFLQTQGELEASIAALLGGRAGEEIVYGDASTGAADDLERATEIARAMVEIHGMGRGLGLTSFGGARRNGELHATPVAAAGEIEEEVRWILEQQHARAGRILRSRLQLLLRARQELLAREVLAVEELETLAAADEAVASGRAPAGS